MGKLYKKGSKKNGRKEKEQKEERFVARDDGQVNYYTFIFKKPVKLKNRACLIKNVIEDAEDKPQQEKKEGFLKKSIAFVKKTIKTIFSFIKFLPPFTFIGKLHDLFNHS